MFLAMGPKSPFRKLRTRARALIPFGFEVAAILLSLRAASILLSDQMYFDRYEANYAWMVEHVTSHEWRLGVLALLAATLKAGGLLFVRARSSRVADAAFVVREVGWALSVAFWGLLGITWTAANPNNLASALGFGVAVFAMGMMLTGPLMPGESDDER